MRSLKVTVFFIINNSLKIKCLFKKHALTVFLKVVMVLDCLICRGKDFHVQCAAYSNGLLSKFTVLTLGIYSRENAIDRSLWMLFTYQ